MDKVVVIICVLAILLAVYILVKAIIKMCKGRCCENCKHCDVKHSCEASMQKEDESNN